MGQDHDIQFLGSEIKNILENNDLPSDDFNLEVRFSTVTFNKISIHWTHYSAMESIVPLERINSTLLDDQLYSLLKRYNFETTNYGLIIGIPYKIFDAYIERFPEELTSPDVISKIGSKNGNISYYYAFLRRKTLEIEKPD